MNRVLPCLLLTCVALNGMGCHSPHPASPTTQAAPFPADAIMRPPFAPLESEKAMNATNELLAKNLPEVELKDIEFEDGIDFYKDCYNWSIHVEWEKLPQGVTRKTLINSHLRNVRGGRALENLLFAADPSKQVTYTVATDGVIYISTRDDLLARFAQTTEFDLGFLRKETQCSAAEFNSHMTNVFKESIDPDGWESPTNPSGSRIAIQGDVLRITATPSTISGVRSILAYMWPQTKAATQPASER